MPKEPILEKSVLKKSIKKRDLSIVIPVYNEQSVLPTLFDRLYPVLDQLDESIEVIFINDGSKDDTMSILKQQHTARLDVTRILSFRYNAGQQTALLAGFEAASGKHIITLDSDLQNPPEEIPKVLEQLKNGHDYVGSVRAQRKDRLWRRLGSQLLNGLRRKVTRVNTTDQGSMLRGYHRCIVDLIVRYQETHAYIPLLGWMYAKNPIEITVAHQERTLGTSKYSLIKLIHTSFDTLTSLTIYPLQTISIMGMALSALSLCVALIMIVLRLIQGTAFVSTQSILFALVFFFLSILLFSVGVLGEYIGRIYVHTRERPRYIIDQELEPNFEGKASKRSVRKK